MTALILILALAVFWGGIILMILSGIGLISIPIWAILLVCGVLIVGCIIAMHLTSVDEYGYKGPELTPDEQADRELKRKFVHGDKEIFDALDRIEQAGKEKVAEVKEREKAQMEAARSAFMFNEHD